MRYNPNYDTQEAIIAHMAPSEIEELAKLEEALGINAADNGKYRMKMAEGGIPDFSALDKVFKHPIVINNTKMFLRKRLKSGGKAVIDDFEVMKKSGRFGDTKLAKLPKSLARVLDSALGKSHNPKTGKREYFIGAILGGLSRFLPSIMGGLGSMFGGGASAAAPAAMGMAGRMAAPMAASTASSGGLGSMFGNLMSSLSNPQLGGMLQNVGMIQQLASPILSMFGGGGQQQQSMPMQQMPQSYGYGGNPYAVQMDLGNPYNQPYQMPAGNYPPMYYGQSYNGQMVPPTQYSRFATTRPMDESEYQRRFGSAANPYSQYLR